MESGADVEEVSNLSIECSDHATLLNLPKNFPICEQVHTRCACATLFSGMIRSTTTTAPANWMGLHMYRSTLSQRQVLRRSPLFARLGDEETDAVLTHARAAKYAAGDQIVVKGDPGDSMMAVLNGRVSRSE